MAGKPIGTMFAEIGLDATKLEKGLKQSHDALVDGTAKVESAYKSLGIKSDAVYEQMRKNATAAVDFIKNKTISSTEEIVRAQQAAANKIKQINEQQYGSHVSMLDSMKKNWVATAAVVAGAWMVVNKAMAWAEIGAKALQTEESFRIVAASANESADKIISGMKRAAAGTVDDSDIMQQAVKGMVLGLKGDEMVHIMDAARVSARVAGEDVKTAYESITNAIATGMPRALKKYGLATKEETAIVEQALKAGVTGINLYTLAMMNAGVQSAKFGALQANAAEGIQVAKAQFQELTETIGKFVIELGTKAFMVVKSFAGILSYMAAPIAYLIGGQSAYNAMVASGNDLLKQAGKLGGYNADEAKKGMEANSAAASATVDRLQKEKAAWIENLKMQIGAKQAAKDALALQKEIQQAQDQIAAAVAKIAADKQKRELDAIKLDGETEARQLAAQSKAADEYEKIVTEAADYSINENDRAINKIIADENKKLGVLYTLYSDNRIGMAELDKAADLVRAQSVGMQEVQAQKRLSDEVNFYSQITGYEDEYRKKQLEWIDEEAKRRAEAYKDDVAAAKWAAQEKRKLEQGLFEKKTSEVHKGLVDMAAAFTAIGSMYDKNSGEYARMQEAAKAMIVLQQAVAVANAVAAIANQGLGDPYTAFARIAAMVAAMGSLLASAGLSLGGGGAASAPVLPASTVLGAAAGTGSESASKSYELLKDTYTLEYRELTGIHDSMRELNANITGLVTSIVRTGGVGSFASAPSATTGWEQQLQASIDKPFLSLMAGDPIGKAITGFISKWGGKLVGSIFGGGTSSSVDSSGIQFGGSSVSGLLAGGGMGAQQYAHITTQHEGGWFKSDWTSGETQYKALDAQVTDMLNATFKSIGSTLVELAKGLGTDTQAAYAYVFAATKINLQGMDTEAINKAISAFISNTADTAVESLFGSMLRGYQQLDEGLLETAVRLVKDKDVISGILEMTNQQFSAVDTMGGWRGHTVIESATSKLIAFSEAIIEMAGGLDVLQKAAGTYFDKFFTDAEKQARLQGQLSGALGDLGYALPGSRGGYRALVEGLDLTTTAGQQAYVMLMQFADAADKYYSAVEDAVGGTDKLTEALKRQSETVQKWLADLNKSTLAPVMSAQAQEAAYASARGAAFAPGAAEAQTSAFLTAASDYLKFARAYSGDYASVYQAVTGDVQGLADAIALALTQSTLPAHAGGGLTRGPTIAGEAGGEWNVPTYEPQRSRFLESAPPQFWENLKGAGVVQPGGGGDITIRVPVYLDGKVVAESVAKHVKRNGPLAEAMTGRRVN